MTKIILIVIIILLLLPFRKFFLKHIDSIVPALLGAFLGLWIEKQVFPLGYNLLIRLACILFTSVMAVGVFKSIFANFTNGKDRE